MLTFVTCLALIGASGDWEQLLEEDGITVYARDNGTSLPTFRGEGIIDTSVLHILAIFRDDGRHEEWMHSCAESTIIKRFSEVEAHVYHRTTVPWPMQDRDVVLHSKLTYDKETLEAWNRFERVNDAKRPPVDGVVRVPHLEGFYHLLVIDAEHTAIVYQVDSDPGGLLPDSFG
jgi:hypothetical protein